MLSFEGYRWSTLAEGAPTTYTNKISLHKAVADVLYRRHIASEDIDTFCHPSTDHFHDPFLFSDMKKACERIFLAISSNESIIIHGDYDADGIGGSVVLSETLELLGADVEVFLPHRDKDGYGINITRAQEFIDKQASVVITCDCGISNIKEVALLQDNGVDVIITDHHQFKETMPPAFAILHPSIPHESYPGEHLAGGGVAFKFAHGLLQYAREVLEHSDLPTAEHFLYPMLDVVAMSTVADMVPLRGESRVIAHNGLLTLQNTQRPGLRVLRDKSRQQEYSSEMISFGIAPKINAPGRMGNPRIAYDLLRCVTDDEAQELLRKIESINNDRRKQTKLAMDEALEQIRLEGQEENSILLVYGEHWPSGIVGLIAGRLKDMFHKPALVMAGRDVGIVGSGRSTNDIHIVQALDQVADCLGKYGGHPQACGFTLKDPSVLPYFEERLLLIVDEMSDGVVAPELIVDASVALQDINWELIRDVQLLAPFGKGNEKPRFVINNVEILQARSVGSKEGTILIDIGDALGNRQKCVGFGKSHYMTKFHLGDMIDVVVELGINSFNGRQEIQCQLVDMRLHS